MSVVASADIEPPSIDAVSEPVKEAELVEEQKELSAELTNAHAANGSVEAATVDEAREVKIEVSVLSPNLNAGSLLNQVQASEIPIAASTNSEHDEPERVIEETSVVSQEEIAATSETDTHGEATFSQVCNRPSVRGY